MKPLRYRIRRWLDRSQGLALVAVLGGTTLAHGGFAWWWRPVLAGLATLLVLIGCLRVTIEGRVTNQFGILATCGLLALMLGAAQLVPLPPSIAGLIAPEARSWYVHGVTEELARRDDPSIGLDGEIGSRSPISIDRSRTLRWSFDAAIGFVVFLSSSGFCRNARHTALLVGTHVAIFSGFTLVGIVGCFDIDGDGTDAAAPRRTSIGPSAPMMLGAPGVSHLRPARLWSAPDEVGPWLVPVPSRVPPLGGVPGGVPAYLAIASIGLPLAVASCLHLAASRGSREPFRSRVASTNRGPLILLLLLVAGAGAWFCGLQSSIGLAGPVAIGLVLVGFAAARTTGLGRWGVLATSSVMLCMAAGYVTGRGIPGLPAITDHPRPSATGGWRDELAAFRDYPIAGAGLGTFARIAPYDKDADGTSNVAASSVAKWGVEAGSIGILLCLGASLWFLSRVRTAWRAIGGADRAFAGGVLAAAIGFAMTAMTHWSAGVPFVALAGCSLLGVLNRWFLPSTDLFIKQAD